LRIDRSGKSQISRQRISGKAVELPSKDVAHGFSIPVSPGIIDKIKEGMVQPFGLATQCGLAEDGSRKVKHRLTQDFLDRPQNVCQLKNRHESAPRDVLRMVHLPNHPLHCQPPTGPSPSPTHVHLQMQPQQRPPKNGALLGKSGSSINCSLAGGCLHCRKVDFRRVTKSTIIVPVTRNGNRPCK
jgi:hypothetical protein